MLHKDFDRKCSVGKKTLVVILKGLGSKTLWLWPSLWRVKINHKSKYTVSPKYPLNCTVQAEGFSHRFPYSCCIPRLSQSPWFNHVSWWLEYCQDLDVLPLILSNLGLRFCLFLRFVFLNRLKHHSHVYSEICRQCSLEANLCVMSGLWLTESGRLLCMFADLTVKVQ
jgi:hypothetical protein